MSVNRKQKPEATEDLILIAAKKVFTRKGLAGSRMQEIADEAGINKALLHYYYRSKENLFDSVFFELLKTIQAEFITILNSDMELFDKIRFFFERYIDFLQENSFLPGFIINEVNRDPERMISYFKNSGIKPPEKLIIQINEEVRKGNIIPVDPKQLLMNILSLAIFPIIAAPLLKGMFETDDFEFSGIIEKRKKELPEWIINAIKPRN